MQNQANQALQPTKIYFNQREISLGSYELQGDYHASEFMTLPEFMNNREQAQARHWSWGKHLGELKRIESTYRDALMKLRGQNIGDMERAAIANFITETLELLTAEMGQKVTMAGLERWMTIHTWMSAYSNGTTAKQQASEMSHILDELLLDQLHA